MTGVVRRIAGWFEERLGLRPIITHVLDHPIPAANTTGKGWMYVFGAATLTAFLIQVVTGIALATRYIPAPANAYDSLVVITEQSTVGWLLRGLHYFGASAMVLLVFVHMARVFLTGSFKYPREVNWMSGAVLLGLTLAMAGTGQLLRWDQDGVWTVIVWAKFAERVPLIGEAFARFILAGDTLGGATLSRFYAFHVFVFPALITLFVALHLYLVLHHGISEPPERGRRVDPRTYPAYYQGLLARGRPYWPYGVWREAVAASVVVVVVLALALTFGPKGPTFAPDPSDVRAVPKPDWFYLWYYTLVWLKPPSLETLTMVYLPLGVGVILFLIPLVASRGERHPARRPWAIVLVGATVLAFGILTAFGLRPYWIPDFRTQPLDAQALGVDHGPVYEGAQIFHARGCQYCHAVLGEGGEYGPDLTRVAARMSTQEIAVRILVGIKDMPAYRGMLPADELEAIVAFLVALRDRKP